MNTWYVKHRKKILKMWRERKWKYICKCGQTFTSAKWWFEAKCYSCRGDNLEFYAKEN